MKRLNSIEIKNVSGGTVSLTTQGSIIDVVLSKFVDNIAIGYGYGVGGNLFLKGDGKVFVNDNYIETSETPKNIYTPQEYFSISSNPTANGWHFKIVPL